MAFTCTIPAVPNLQQDDAMLRITRWDFEPGAVTGWHEHGWPYFVIMLEAGTLRLHNGTEITDVLLTKGQSYMRPAGIKHDVMNASPHAISFVEIEVKQAGQFAGMIAVQDQLLSPESPASPHPLTDAIRAGLRRATPADAAAVRDLTRAAYAKWVPVLGREPKPMTADYDMAVRDHVVDVLHLDGELAALIEMQPEANHLLIVNVAVSPAYQGRGYGRALLAHAEELTRSLGLREMRLYTSVHLTENVKLYERVGYKVDREEEASPHLGVFVHMSKPLL